VFGRKTRSEAQNYRFEPDEVQQAEGPAEGPAEGHELEGEPSQRERELHRRVHELTKQMSKTKRMKSYWKHAAVSARKEKASLKATLESRQFHKRSRVKTTIFSKLSMRGGYRLALKRGLGHASAASLIGISISIQIFKLVDIIVFYIGMLRGYEGKYV